MNEYICGPIIEAANGEEAISQVTPIYSLQAIADNSETIVCIPRLSLGIPFVVGLFLTTMALFSILGVIAGKTNALKKILKYHIELML